MYPLRRSVSIGAEGVLVEHGLNSTATVFALSDRVK